MQIKKFARSDRYGNSLSIEFEVPPIENEVPHPGGPKGTDTVPAWLTPGERVMNAEAEREFGPLLAQMNGIGRDIQRAQGGTIPEYAAGGCKVKYAAKGSKASCDCPECSRTVYANNGMKITQGEGFIPFESLPGFELIKEQEGFSPIVYNDDAVIDGAQSVGYGHRLLSGEKTSGYTQQELEDLYMKDFLMSQQDARENIPGFNTMPTELQGAFTSQAYQLGDAGQEGFEKMIAALDEGDRAKAMAEVQNSDWARQTPQRANYLYNTIAMNDLQAPPPVTEGDSLYVGMETFAEDQTTDDSVIRDVAGQQGQGVPKPDIEIKVPKPQTTVKTPTTKQEFDKLVTFDDIKDDPDWQVISTGKQQEPSFLSKAFDYIKDEIMDTGLIDTKQLTKAALLYAGSRALGYDHTGSGQYAVKNYLTGIANKDKHINKLIESGDYTSSSIDAYRKSGDTGDLKKKTELKLGSDIKVGSVKLKDGSRAEVPVQFDSNSGRWGYYDNTNTFNPVSAGSVRDRQQPRTAEDTANAWRIMSKDWADSSSKVINNAINNKRKESLTEDGIYVLTGAEIAQQAESAFKDMGYDVFSPTQIREMPTIINQAIRNYSKNIEKYPEASFEPYLRQEIYKASLAGSEEALELFVLNPKETNLAKREPVSPRIVGRTFEQVESIAESFLSSQDKYKGKEIPLSAIQGKRNYYMRQAVIHYNSPEGKDLRNRYPGYETENGEKVSGVLQYVQAIMQDSKISDDEIGMTNKNKATQ